MNMKYLILTVLLYSSNAAATALDVPDIANVCDHSKKLVRSYVESSMAARYPNAAFDLQTSINAINQSFYALEARDLHDVILHDVNTLQTLWRPVRDIITQDPDRDKLITLYDRVNKMHQACRWG